MILSCGDRLQPGLYQLHSRFTRACNFAHNNRLVSIVTTDIGPGPLNIVVEQIPPLRRLKIDHDVIWIDHTPYHVGENARYNSTISLLFPLDQDIICGNIEVALEWVLSLALPECFASLLLTNRWHRQTSFLQQLARQAIFGTNLLLGGNPALGARYLRGLGFGLTPSGDDFLAGALVAYHVACRHLKADLDEAAEAIYQHSLGINAISNSMLWCAKDGFLPERLKLPVQYIINGRPSHVQACMRSLLNVGETSGIDFITGFLLALSKVVCKEGWRTCLCMVA